MRKDTRLYLSFTGSSVIHLKRKWLLSWTMLDFGKMNSWMIWMIFMQSLTCVKCTRRHQVDQLLHCLWYRDSIKGYVWIRSGAINGFCTWLTSFPLSLCLYFCRENAHLMWLIRWWLVGWEQVLEWCRRCLLTMEVNSVQTRRENLWVFWTSESELQLSVSEWTV